MAGLLRFSFAEVELVDTGVPLEVGENGMGRVTRCEWMNRWKPKASDTVCTLNEERMQAFIFYRYFTSTCTFIPRKSLTQNHSS